MLSAVLRSRTAVQVSIGIMDAFVEIRRFVAGNAAMFERIGAVELRQLEYQKSTDERFEEVFGLLEEAPEPAQKMFFEGQVYDAFSLLAELVHSAEREMLLVDGHVDVRTLNVLAKKREGVRAIVCTRDNGRLSREDAETFNAQYPTLEVRRTSAFHDRFLVLDGTRAFLVGASLKDAGRKCFAISPIVDTQALFNLREQLSLSA